MTRTHSYNKSCTEPGGSRRLASSSIQLSATGRLLDITYMCYVFRTPLFPAQLLLARQFDLSVTSIPQSVSRWRHNEYSWCSHPLHFVQALHTPVVKVRLVVWRSDLTGQGGRLASGSVFSYELPYIVGFWLVEMAISTNQKPTIYRNSYDNTGPDLYKHTISVQIQFCLYTQFWQTWPQLLSSTKHSPILFVEYWLLFRKWLSFYIVIHCDTESRTWCHPKVSSRHTIGTKV